MLNRRAFIQTSALVIVTALLFKLLGLAERLVLAAAFGIGASADAALVASNVTLLLGYLLLDVVDAALIPTLLGHAASARTRISGTLLSLTLALLVLLALLGWWQGRALLALLAPGFDAATQTLALQVLRAGLLSLPALGAAAILVAHLQAHGRYLQPAISDLALRIGPILGLLVIGGINGLALGMLCGALLRLLLLLRPGLITWPRWAIDDQGVRQALQRAWPLLLTSIISVQLFAVIEGAIASTVGTGVLASLAYARRIADLPVYLVPQVIARVALPTLAGLAASRERLARSFRLTIELTLLLLLPPTLLGMLLAEPVVRLIYLRGAFDESAVVPTVTALWALLPGLPALGLFVLVVRFSYALGDTKGPSVLRVAGMLLHVALALLLRPWGIAGIAWASTLTLWLEVVLLIVYLARKSAMSGSQPLVDWRSLLRLALSAALMVLVAAQLDVLLPQQAGTLGLLARLAIVGCSASVAYGACLFGLGLRPQPLRATNPSE